MNPSEIVMLAVRLLGVSTVVLLLPGLLLLAALRATADWPERIVLAFSVSYSWIFVLSVVLPLFGWNADHAAALTALLVVGLGGMLASRRWAPPSAATRPPQPRIEVLLIAAVMIACAVTGWVIEPPFTGEESFDLVSAWRFADGGPITFDNTSLFPDARPVYLFQPYQLALGLISRWSDTDPLVALIKMRAFLAPLTLIFVYSLLRRWTATRVEAGAAFVVVLLFVVLDMDTWQWNSLFPFVRRGGVGAGICVPALMVLCLAATRRAHDPGGRAARRVALVTAPLMLVASLSTHPLEMFTLLFFAVAVVTVVLAGLDRQGDRRQAVALMLLLVVSTGVYLAAHSRFVPYVAEHERSDKESLRVELAQLALDPVMAITGGPTEARALLSRTLPGTTATVFGIPALALAALRAPAVAATIALGIVPLALVYAMPAGLIVLKLLTSVETATEVNAYYGLLGLLGLALGLTAAVHALLSAAAWRRQGFRQVVTLSGIGSVVAWIAWRGGEEGVRWLANRTAVQPEVLLLIAVIVAVFVLAVAAMRPLALLQPAPFPAGVILLTACLAIPFAVPERVFGGIFEKRTPISIIDTYRAALESPSVLEWPAYYETFNDTLAASLTVPRDVVDELRGRLAPRQIVLAHPSYSCALVVLIDAYCINLEEIYGHYFRPGARYLAEYVRRRDGQSPEHPFFNTNPLLTETEVSLLRDFGVSYVLADPDFAEQIDRKLREAAVGATIEMNRHGYRLYRIGS